MKSKRLKELQGKVDKSKIYTIDEALDFIFSQPKLKFTESVEMHFRLGIDPKKGDQQVRTSVTLPHGTGKTKKIAVFATEGSQAEADAKEAKADLIGGNELIEKIKQTGTIDFDIAITTPEMMKDLAKIARVLGPRGLMPSPKNETVTKDIKKAVEELRGGKVTVKNDETSNVHQIIGKASFEKNQLAENAQILIDAIKKAKPSSSKGTYIKGITLCSTMGPGLKIQIPA